MATIIKRPYTAPIDFRKNAEDDIVTAFYKNNEVKLIYKGDKKIFESKRLYTTFTANTKNSLSPSLKASLISPKSTFDK